MSQAFVSPGDIDHKTFLLRGTEARHVIRVLRKKVGDKLDIFDGCGRRWEGRLTDINPDTATARGEILREMSLPTVKPALHLFQGLPRGSKFDYVLEKSTEVGVDVILPFLSEKNPIRNLDQKIIRKMTRWESVIKAASKQCNRSTLPLLEHLRPLREFEPRLKTGFTIVPDLGEKKWSLREILKQIVPDTALVNIVIGPESGFSLTEKAWLLAQGAHLVSLGNNTLRTETAGLAVLSILNYELGRI